MKTKTKTKTARKKLNDGMRDGEQGYCIFLDFGSDMNLTEAELRTLAFACLAEIENVKHRWTAKNTGVSSTRVDISAIPQNCLEYWDSKDGEERTISQD